MAACLLLHLDKYNVSKSSPGKFIRILYYYYFFMSRDHGHLIMDLAILLMVIYVQHTTEDPMGPECRLSSDGISANELLDSPVSYGGW